jgi:hypothetical protein
MTRRAVAVAAVAVLGVAACASSGANAEDERRLAVLEADPLLLTIPDGGTVTSGPSGETASSDIAWADGGGRTSAGAVHALTGSDQASSWFYVDALVDQGWTAVEAQCTRLNDTGRWVVTIGAARWYDGFEGRAAVSIEPDGDASRAIVAVKAPFHTEAGSPPAPVPPQATCIEAIG